MHASGLKVERLGKHETRIFATLFLYAVSPKKEGEIGCFRTQRSFIASSRGTATIVSISTSPTKRSIAFMASFSVGASVIATAS